MSLAETIASPPALPESQKAALLKLLGDEDPAVFHAVRDKILSYGPSAADWLRPQTLSREPALRRRAQELVLRFDAQAADNHFLAFCLKHGEECDLEQGSWLLAQTQYPNINVDGYRAVLDSFARDLQERLDGPSQPKKMLESINHYLFSDLAFSGNEKNYYDPENSYLNRVLDRRMGNPITLCLVYILLARRLRLPVAGIGLPGHFICRYQSSATEVYIDAFNRGKLLTKADCIQYLLHGNYSVRDDYLAPVSPRRMLLRICANLHQIYLQLEKQEPATRLQRYLVALAR
ncbi:MAG TPA: transglutaminase-like domain-containing protein [Candidatus Binatia bacterium]|jgi:regulator of sirC expression with transglutaminase-like and TPR domain|nr:transglutaminase-like domain-containing protein [Candidatus Binatia bacterium]